MVSQTVTALDLIDPRWTFVPTIWRTAAESGWYVEFVPPPGSAPFFAPVPRLLARWGVLESRGDCACRVRVDSESLARSLHFQLIELVEEINRF